MNFHNPRNLPTPGERPWRFLLTSELDLTPEDTEVWDNVKEEWMKSYCAGDYCPFRMFTYRTKTPLPNV